MTKPKRWAELHYAGRARTVPKRVHPLVARLFQRMIREQVRYADLALRAGVGPNTILRWRKRINPSLCNLVAVAQVLGLSLVLLDEDEAEFLFLHYDRKRGKPTTLGKGMTSGAEAATPE